MEWCSEQINGRGAKGAVRGNFLRRSRLRQADIGALFQTPGEVAREIVENDAHLNRHELETPGHKTLLPERVKELKGLDREDIMVGGGVIPAQDYDFLYENGALAIFGLGTVIPVAAQKVIAELDRRHA
ncbi:MAG: methylmalonyl-CoA mutase [Candidatus Kentron sp. G]|nr:MAG: methylmalonyl-CoA mutase [Candidatus Kentron sp. G]VFM98224.1 MAG: methylmalonyl-CoA mutase [Candidatus Kentron sp. G]VFN04980.1 MAG: methylmalonyl-CoA mutase [Candidatus Kentron sp. G]